MEGIIESVLTLEALSVESNVPVCGVVNQLEKFGYDRVQAVSYDCSQRCKPLVNCRVSYNEPAISSLTNFSKLWQLARIHLSITLVFEDSMLGSNR